MIALICDKCDKLIESSENAIDTYQAGVLQTPALSADQESFGSDVRYRVFVHFDKMNSYDGIKRRLQLCRSCKIELLKAVGDLVWVG